MVWFGRKTRSVTTIIFTLVSDIKWTIFHLSSTIIAEVSLSGYVIQSSADAVCVSWRIYNTANWSNSSNNSDRTMVFGWLNGGEDCEYYGVVFVDISKVFVTQDAFFFGTDCWLIGWINRSIYQSILSLLGVESSQESPYECRAGSCFMLCSTNHRHPIPAIPNVTASVDDVPLSNAC